MYIVDLVAEPDRGAHIARHGVTMAEAHEVVFGAPFMTRTRQGRHRFIGRTYNGRYLAVIAVRLGAGVVGHGERR